MEGDGQATRAACADIASWQRSSRGSSSCQGFPLPARGEPWRPGCEEPPGHILLLLWVCYRTPRRAARSDGGRMPGRLGTAAIRCA